MNSRSAPRVLLHNLRRFYIFIDWHTTHCKSEKTQRQLKIGQILKIMCKVNNHPCQVDSRLSDLARAVLHSKLAQFRGESWHGKMHWTGEQNAWKAQFDRFQQTGHSGEEEWRVWVLAVVYSGHRVWNWWQILAKRIFSSLLLAFVTKFFSLWASIRATLLCSRASWFRHRPVVWIKSRRFAMRHC